MKAEIVFSQRRAILRKRFEFVEEAFDLMTFLVEPPVDGRLGGAAGVGLDVSGCAEVIGDEGA